jgi:hypothetical protein
MWALGVLGLILNLLKPLIISISFLLTACTTGHLYYVDSQGNIKLGCDVEFVGLPSVYKYAVEYALSLCAKSIVKKGHTIRETYLLDVDTTIPDSPCNNRWSHEIAKQNYKKGDL